MCGVGIKPIRYIIGCHGNSDNIMYQQYRNGQILEGHTSSVTSLAATYVMANAVSTIVASASSDSTVIIWLRDSPAGEIVQKLLMHN